MSEHENAAHGLEPGARPAAEPLGDVPAGGTGAGAESPGRPDSWAPLRRDRSHRLIAGVCAGLGRRYDMDPVIFRIALPVLAVTGGLGLIFYGFAWLLVPSEDEEESEARKLLTGRVDAPTLAALLLSLVGCGLFLAMLNNGGVLSFAVLLSLVLLGAGHWSRRRGLPGPDPLAAQTAAEAPPEAQAPPVPPVPTAGASWWRASLVEDGGVTAGDPTGEGRRGSPSGGGGGEAHFWGTGPDRLRERWAAAGRSGPGGGAMSDGKRARRDRPRWIGGWVFLAAVAAGGLATGLAWASQPALTSVRFGLAAALTVFGVGLVIGAFRGRLGAGTIVVAVVTAALLAATAALPAGAGDEWARPTWRPTAAAEVREGYGFASGEGTLDLSGVSVPAGETVRTRAEADLGRILVILPPDATARLSVSVGLGDLLLPEEDRGDADVAPGRHRELTLSPTRPGEEAGGVLDLEVRVGVGEVVVSRAEP
ncbi:PspC domain-containing protein [Streptomyces sp. WMMC905]|uniref:PspC domain-containing protein n=1 Tax=Streptomyces sp. WMMC905 TaxID=3404123 RepID=UPI003B923B40